MHTEQYKMQEINDRDFKTGLISNKLESGSWQYFHLKSTSSRLEPIKGFASFAPRYNESEAIINEKGVRIKDIPQKK